MPHINDFIDFTVEVFIVFGDRVLLRRHDKYGIWLSIGGHIEPREDPNEAAIREVREEVGIDVRLDDSLRTFDRHTQGYVELIPPYFLNRHRIDEGHEHVTLTYFALAASERLSPTNGIERSSACRWFTREQVESSDELDDRVRHYALKALTTLAKPTRSR